LKHECSTIGLMSRPPKKRPDRHSSRNMIRLRDEMHQQLEKLKKITRRTKTEDVHIALEEYLAKYDLWPPADSSAD